MKFTFKVGICLVVAITIATLVAIGGVCRLSVTERVEQAMPSSPGAWPCRALRQNPLMYRQR
jgi:hypothetical protein